MALMSLKKTFWLLPFLAAVPLLAVTPFFWETRTNDDFRKGTFSSLSLTSEDHLVLAPRFESLFSTEQPFVWSAAADSKGNVYLGTGHDGKVYRVDSSGKGALLADLYELDIFAIAIDSKDAVYAARVHYEKDKVRSLAAYLPAETTPRNRKYGRRRPLSARLIPDHHYTLAVLAADDKTAGYGIREYSDSAAASHQVFRYALVRHLLDLAKHLP